MNKRFSTYIALRGVMHLMCSPENVDFMSSAMHPIVAKVNGEEGEQMQPPGNAYAE